MKSPSDQNASRHRQIMDCLPVIQFDAMRALRRIGREKDRELYDELIQHGFVIASRAFEKLDPSIAKLQTLIKANLYWDLLKTAMLIRRHNIRKQRTIFEDDRIGSDAEKTINLLSLIPDGLINDEELQIVRMYYGFEGQASGLREIAKVLNKSTSYIHQHLRRALAVLRDWAENRAEAIL